jgi:MraZ protein
MLRGNATAKIDDKGRFKVPAAHLSGFLELCGDDRRVFVTSRDGSLVLIYPMPIWEKVEEKLSTLPSLDPHVQTYKRAVNYWGQESAVDQQGRLRIHGKLRRSARLTEDISVFGMQDVLEVCDERLFEHDPPTVDDECLAHLAELGL